MLKIEGKVVTFICQKTKFIVEKTAKKGKIKYSPEETYDPSDGDLESIRESILDGYEFHLENLFGSSEGKGEGSGEGGERENFGNQGSWYWSYLFS